ncbi:hypothetical protein [Gluconacetobacter asukensis]|uniref:Uncharacterized protein n=1 Tax=Gluconacetobacter asukensis TaxID=1017181 RepID=A0A7W4P0M4_9PROT|nr:hypothetical protein [Gluconacetobacter asukensis]MBB2170833.1 hypothetical protein [Gluconacetobacter asukensis]
MVALCIRLLGILLDVYRGDSRWSHLIFPSGMMLICAIYASGTQIQSQARLLVACVELLLVFIAIKSFTRNTNNKFIFPEQIILEKAEAFFPPRTARILATELVVIVSIFSGIRRSYPRDIQHATRFGYTDNAILRWIPLILVFCSPVDIGLTHLALRALHTNAAKWTLLILFADIYTIIWIFGILEAMRQRPHYITENKLVVFRGPYKRAEIDLAQILSVEVVETPSKRSIPGAEKMTLKGVPTVQIQLNRPIHLVRWLKIDPTPISTFLVAADQPRALHEAVMASKKSLSCDIK